MPEALPLHADRQSAGRALGMSLGIGAFLAVAYIVLRRHTSHEYDIYWMLPRLQARQLEYSHHPLALHLADAWAQLLEFSGGSLHERLKAACGLSTGIAVGVLAHAAWLLRGNLASAAVTAVTFACLPSTVHFATLMELHALFLPFAAAALWVACRMVAGSPRTTMASALVLGTLTALASGVHATGHLMVGFLCLWLTLEWRSRGKSVAGIVSAVTCFVLTHVAGTAVIAKVALSAQAPSPAAEQIDFLGLDHFSLHDFQRTTWWEWIVPFFPVSVLWLWAFARRPRALPTALLLSLGAYLAACQALLVVPGFGYSFHEYGAYQLPIAFFATLLAVDQLRGRLRLVIVLTALLAGSYAWSHPSKPPADQAFGRVALSYLQSQDVRLIVGGYDEYDAIFDLTCSGPDWDKLSLRLLNTPQLLLYCKHSHATDAAQLAAFLHPGVAGRVTVLTAEAIDALRKEGGIYAELVDEVLPTVFTLETVRVVGAAGEVMDGIRLIPR